MRNFIHNTIHTAQVNASVVSWSVSVDNAIETGLEPSLFAYQADATQPTQGNGHDTNCGIDPRGFDSNQPKAMATQPMGSQGWRLATYAHRQQHPEGKRLRQLRQVASQRTRVLGHDARAIHRTCC